MSIDLSQKETLLEGAESKSLNSSGRRAFFNVLAGGMTAGAMIPLLGTRVASAKESDAMAKIVFVLFRRSDMSHQQSVGEWSGDLHVGIVKKVFGVRKWVQNHLVTPPNSNSPDGIGEMWFENAETMGKAMSSPEMGVAFEDAKRFLDLEKTFALTVSEKKFLG